MKTIGVNTFSISAIFLMAVFAFTSCAELNNTNDTTAEKIDGMWSVSENSQEFGEQHYKTEITRNMYLDDQVSIYNFFALGSWVSVPATVSGNDITIIPADVEGWNIQGTGKINSDYNKIDFDFTVEELSGNKADPVQVSAIFTKDN